MCVYIYAHTHTHSYSYSLFLIFCSPLQQDILIDLSLELSPIPNLQPILIKLECPLLNRHHIRIISDLTAELNLTSNKG